MENELPIDKSQITPPPELQSSTSVAQDPPIVKNRKPRTTAIAVGVGITVLVFGAIGYLFFTKSNLSSPKLSNNSIPSNFEPASTQSTPSDSSKANLFDKLTANSWCNKSDISGESMLAPTAKNYTFSKNGTYKWSHFSDYPEGSGQGNWNFEANDTDSGIIFLSSGDAWGFVIKGDRISLTGERLGKCDPISGNGNSYTFDSLPKVNRSDLFNNLTSQKWKKTNELDLFRLPTDIEFQPNGKYVAIFNNGE